MTVKGENHRRTIDYDEAKNHAYKAGTKQTLMSRTNSVFDGYLPSYALQANQRYLKNPGRILQGRKGASLEEIKMKLSYEWKNVYRYLCNMDPKNRGFTSMAIFVKALQAFNVFLSKTELTRLSEVFEEK